MSNKKSRGFLLLFPSLLIVSRLSSSSQTTSSLKFVQILFRHGDRNPNRPWGPDDPNPESVWPQGWGQLTDLGKRQLFELGEQTKRRYEGLLGAEYKNEELYVRSTGRDRALMSAQCFLAGLFPVDPKTSWNSKVNWQPIPIHSKTIVDDWIMRCTKACPETADFYLDGYYRTSPSIAAYIAENKAFIDHVTKSANLYDENDDVHNMKKMWKLGGNLHIARRYNKTLPSWADDAVVDELIRLRSKKFESQASSSPELTKLSGGPLLGHLLDNFDRFRRGILRPEDHGQKESGDERMKDLKMMIFSGHDTNMVFLLSALRLFDPPFWPSYAATLFLELHEVQGRHYVQIFYQDGVDAERRELRIPGCAALCPLDQLIETSGSTAVWSLEEFEGLCIKNDKPSKRSDFGLPSPMIFLSLASMGITVWILWKTKEAEKLDAGSKPNKMHVTGGGEKAE